VPNYRRWRVAGGTFFFTLATASRRRILITEQSRTLLRAAIDRQRTKRPFQVIAFVLLPDHLHTVWQLPVGDDDYSTRWSAIKEDFTRQFLRGGGQEASVSDSRRFKRERGVWQRRFWEHTCRDEADLKRFVDYIHWNPCKHGLVRQVSDYPWSSFHRFVRGGEYEEDWGSVDPCPDWNEPEWE